MTGTGSVPRLVVDGGTLNGGGTITVAPGTAAMNSANLDTGVTLRNQGTVSQDAALSLYNGAKVENQGTWNSPPSAGGWYVNTDNSAGVEFRNTVTGQVNVDPGASNAFLFYAPLVNNGTITTTSGSLQIVGGVSGTGSFVQTTPGELSVASGQTVDVFGLTFSGTGVVHVVSGGVLTGTGRCPGWWDGGTLNGGGSITVPAGGAAALDGANLDTGVTLRNQGTVNQSSALNLTTARRSTTRAPGTALRVQAAGTSTPTTRLAWSSATP